MKNFQKSDFLPLNKIKTEKTIYRTYKSTIGYTKIMIIRRKLKILFNFKK